MTGVVAFDVDDPHLAAAGWSRLAEPGDPVAGWLVGELGAPAALRWLLGAVGDPPAAVRTLLRGGARSPADTGEETPPRPGSATRLARAVERWAVRLDRLDPRRELRVLYRLGGTLLVPGDPGWPPGFDDLQIIAPFCLWVRGPAPLSRIRSIAVVGARASTPYGDLVAEELAADLADRGVTVVSGGAYGIDAAAHRGALAAGGTTIAFLAGGVDRFYPAGNAQLLHRVVEHGAVVSEVPPGSVPSKARFLQRNRLIAAAAGACVVVEAAWRSGALSTANHAAALLRPVGAVPGPITSMASAGCHRLLRDGQAVCVTDADEIVELVELAGSRGDAPAGRSPAVHSRTAYDELDEVGRRLVDALPLRRGAGARSLARAAGLTEDEVLAGLGQLELAGLALRDAGRWRRTPHTGDGR